MSDYVAVGLDFGSTDCRAQLCIPVCSSDTGQPLYVFEAVRFAPDVTTTASSPRASERPISVAGIVTDVVSNSCGIGNRPGRNALALPTEWLLNADGKVESFGDRAKRVAHVHLDRTVHGGEFFNHHLESDFGCHLLVCALQQIRQACFNQLEEHFQESLTLSSIKFVLALGLPSELDLKQQLWFQQAAQEAGFVSIHTLESSSCCFLSLLHSKTLQHRQQKLDTDQRIDDADDDDLLLHPGVYVSVDMGAFGPCASLIRRTGDGVEVLGSVGCPGASGDHATTLLLQHALKVMGVDKYNAPEGLDVAHLFPHENNNMRHNDYRRLFLACEHAKVDLSVAVEAEIFVPMWGKSGTIRINVTREEAAKIFSPMEDLLEDALRQLISLAISREESVCGVLVCGGASRSSHVTNVLSRLFGVERLRLLNNRRVRSHVVSHGAALFAGQSYQRSAPSASVSSSNSFLDRGFGLPRCSPAFAAASEPPEWTLTLDPEVKVQSVGAFTFGILAQIPPDPENPGFPAYRVYPLIHPFTTTPDEFKVIADPILPKQRSVLVQLALGGVKADPYTLEDWKPLAELRALLMTPSEVDICVEVSRDRVFTLSCRNCQTGNTVQKVLNEIAREHIPVEFSVAENHTDDTQKCRDFYIDHSVDPATRPSSVMSISGPLGRRKVNYLADPPLEDERSPNSRRSSPLIPSRPNFVSSASRVPAQTLKTKMSTPSLGSSVQPETSSSTAISPPSTRSPSPDSPLSPFQPVSATNLPPAPASSVSNGQGGGVLKILSPQQRTSSKYQALMEAELSVETGTLDLQSKPFGDPGVLALSQQLCGWETEGTRIHSVNLSNAHVTDSGVRCLSSALAWLGDLKPRILLKHLNLSDNKAVSFVGCCFLSLALCSSPSLQRLNLSGCQVNDEGACWLARGLVSSFMDDEELRRALKPFCKDDRRVQDPVLSSTLDTRMECFDTALAVWLLSPEERQDPAKKEISQRAAFSADSRDGVVIRQQISRILDSTLQVQGHSNLMRIASRMSDASKSATCGLMSLSLNDCGIGDAGACALGEALKQNPVLASLFVQGNNFSELGIIGLAFGLVGNTHLKTFDVSRNKIGEQGITNLLEAVMVNQNLVELGVSGVGMRDSSLRQLLRVMDVAKNLKIVWARDNVLSSEVGHAVVDFLQRREDVVEFEIQGGTVSNASLAKIASIQSDRFPAFRSQLAQQSSHDEYVHSKKAAELADSSTAQSTAAGSSSGRSSFGGPLPSSPGQSSSSSRSACGSSSRFPTYDQVAGPRSPVTADRSSAVQPSKPVTGGVGVAPSTHQLSEWSSSSPPSSGSITSRSSAAPTPAFRHSSSSAGTPGTSTPSVIFAVPALDASRSPSARIPGSGSEAQDYWTSDRATEERAERQFRQSGTPVTRRERELQLALETERRKCRALETKLSSLSSESPSHNKDLATQQLQEEITQLLRRVDTLEMRRF